MNKKYPPLFEGIKVKNEYDVYIWTSYYNPNGPDELEKWRYYTTIPLTERKKFEKKEENKEYKWRFDIVEKKEGKNG